MDFAADEELRKLEEKMGLGAPMSTETVENATPVDESAVDSELDALEKRLNQGQ